MRRLSGKFLQVFLPENDAEGRPEWLVGSRYEVIRPVELINKTPGSRGEVVKLSPQSIALVLAIRSVEDEGQEVIMGYLAKSCGYKGDRSWPCGWAQLWRPNEGPKLSRRPSAPGWSLGGCYRVKGRPVLRLYADLDTEALCELQEKEEVLLLDLALAVTKSDNEPRLRGKVRTDRGVVGWLTIELPGSAALLHNVNLHCKEAVLSNVSPLPLPVALDFASCNAEHRRSTRRAPAPSVAGVAMYPWDVGGVYRTLEKLQLDEGPTLRAGKLVKVEAIRPFASNTGVDQHQLRLNLKVETGTMAGRSGWISTSSCIAEAALDVRNHLEFQQVTESPAPAEEWIAEEVFTIRLQRTATCSALGVQLRGLEVDAVLEEGALPRWNKAASPEQRVQRGDRIVAVNGLRDSTESMISEMKEKEILYVRLLRRDAGLPRTGSRRPSKAEVLPKDEPSEAAEEQWKSERPALAAPAQLIVSKASKESTKIHLAEDAEPEWKLFHEGAAPEEAQGHCCRDQCRCRGPCKEHCNEELVLSWLSCGVKRGVSVSRGLLEPAPEPSNG